MSKSIEELKSLTTQIRRDILRMVHAVSSGPVSYTHLFAQLYDGKDFKLREELSKKYDYVSYLSDDVAVFRTKNQKEGVIDSLGNILVEPRFSYIADFENGLAEEGNNFKGNFKRGILIKKAM